MKLLCGLFGHRYSQYRAADPSWLFVRSCARCDRVQKDIDHEGCARWMAAHLDDEPRVFQTHFMDALNKVLE